MGGTALAGQLVASQPDRLESAVRFELASSRHDAALRRLLRENPMPGRISLSLEREPDYFAASAIEGQESRTIVAIDGDRVICAGSISARLRFINGSPMRIGYLGGLRMDASCRGHGSVIRRGFDYFRQLHEQGGPPIYLTSIIADNLRARRLLENGLKGMPAYRFLTEFVTLVIRRRPPGETRKRLRSLGTMVMQGGQRLICDTQPTEAVLDLLNRDYRQYQFAPFWTAQESRLQEFRSVCSQDGTPVACAAIWDQRAIKQTVVRGYANSTRWIRPLINLGSLLLSRPSLPRVGEPVSHAFVSHLAVDVLQPQLAELLFLLLQGPAHRRGIDYLTIGFDARDPRLGHFRRVFRPREYVSRLYAVHWDDDGAKLARALDDRTLAPEVALL